MGAKQLCLQLLQADLEAEVIDILKRHGFWDDPSAWADYGHNENNWSIIGNQQGRAEAALVEKIINAHDSVLMGRCRREGLDPGGSKGKVPKTIREALQRYFKLGKNHLAGIGSQQRITLAEQTCGLVATGTKQRPSYAIFDFGEGQNGDDFFDTLLSLAKSNKLTVPFVQGKFNQGSTGALRFCGEKCIQLILSKRDPEIEGADGKWAFTVTRQFEPDEKSRRRSSVIRCLSPGGKIMQFSAETLPILPTKTAAFGAPMRHGTYIKLYEYNVAPALSTHLLLNMHFRLSALLVEPVLPVRLYERRSYGGHSLESTLNGLELRLFEDGEQKNIESGFPMGSAFTTAAGDFKLRIFAFRKDANPRQYSGSDGILFTINGQTHGAFHRQFFQRKQVGMDYLARSLIVVVDCSALSARAVEQIFMPSRDRLADGRLTKELEQVLSEIIRDNGALQELRQKRRQEELTAKIGDNKQAQEIFNTIVRKSPILSKLLITGEKILNPYAAKSGKDEGKQEFRPSYSPSFLTLLRPNSAEAPRLVEVGRTARIQLSTDAPNDYLVRTVDQGTFALTSSDDRQWHKHVNPYDGVWTLNVEIPEDFPVDRSLTFTCTLGDDTMPAPLSVSFWVRSVPYVPQEAHGGAAGEKKKLPNTGAGENRPPPGLALPHIIEVRTADWSEHEFGPYSALRVVSAGDGSYDFYVNMDNLYLINEVQASRTDKMVLENRFKLVLVFIGVAILAEQNNDNADTTAADDEELNIPDKERLIRLVSEWVAPIVLPLLEELTKAELEESILNYEPG